MRHGQRVDSLPLMLFLKSLVETSTHFAFNSPRKLLTIGVPKRPAGFKLKFINPS
jgi:hypothetical protein